MSKKGSTKRKKKFLKLPNPEFPSKSKLPSRRKLEQNSNYKSCYPNFSFKYYDQKNKYYSSKSIKHCKDFHLLFNHLQRYSQITWGEIEKGKNHAHEVTWSHTTQKKGFPNKLWNDINKYPPYQFQVFSEFRIFGFHLQGVFYVVWFDRFHKVIPM